MVCQQMGLFYDDNLLSNLLSCVKPHPDSTSWIWERSIVMTSQLMGRHIGYIVSSEIKNTYKLFTYIANVWHKSPGKVKQLCLNKKTNLTQSPFLVGIVINDTFWSQPWSVTALKYKPSHTTCDFTIIGNRSWLKPILFLDFCLYLGI